MGEPMPLFEMPPTELPDRDEVVRRQVAIVELLADLGDRRRTAPKKTESKNNLSLSSWP
jgi:hypothetical protein